MSKNFYCGIVESRDDPLCLGRVRVRIAGCHTYDRKVLPTEDLPWASVLDSSKGVPTEGTLVSVQFWDYPDNQMPVVIGTLTYIPQRETVFIEKNENDAQLKDTITPNGRKIATNDDEATGGIDSNVPMDTNNPPKAYKNAVQSSNYESSDTQVAVVNAVTNESSVSIGGTGALSQLEQSIGKSTKSRTDELYDNIASYGDIAKAQMATMEGLSESLGTSLPTDLMSGTESISSLTSGINSSLKNLTDSLGVSTAANVLTKLTSGSLLGNVLGNKLKSKAVGALGASGITTVTQVTNVLGTVGSGNLTNTLTNVVGNKLKSKAVGALGAGGITKVTQAANVLGTVTSGNLTGTLTNVAGNAMKSSVVGALGASGISSLTKASNACATLNLPNVADFAGSMGTGLDSLTSELSALSSVNTDSLMDTASDSLSSLTSSASSLSSVTIESVDIGTFSLPEVSLPDNLSGLVGQFGDLQTAMLENADALIGQGYSSVVALQSNLGGVKSAEEAVKDAEDAIKDLKKTNVTLTTENFQSAKVDEGTTPPSSGSNGGANYGGANATNTAPSKQDTSKYTNGVSREVDISSISSTGDLSIILSVAKECGITTTESLATYLTIIYYLNGSYTQRTENTNYTEEELRKNFPITFGKASSDVVRQYTLGKKKDKDFLAFVYDSANDGITYGNTYPSDASLYFGYGYIKIIGRSAYTRYAKMLDKKELLTKGVEAFKDKSLCAKVSAYEFLEKTKTLPPTAHPQFFYDACSVFGVDSKKAEGYYCKLYGANTQDIMGVGRKSAGGVRSSSSLYQYSGDNSLNGFTDPNKKYPTEDSVCEPTLSKLSRGDIKNSVVSLKEQKRRLGVPLPMNMGSWSQPHASYGAKYPFNKVEESESGHVIEVDDTPNRERLHWYHRSGTFTEVDASGVKVQRIIGDNYVITDRNGFVSIEGDADVTVGGNVNVYCRSNANIQVEGTANLEVGRNLDIGVAKDVNIRTEGNFNVWANGDFNLQAKNNGHILAKHNLYASADSNVHLLAGYITKNEEKKDVKVGGNLFVESYGNSDYVSLGNTKLYTQGSLSDKVCGNRYNEVGGFINNLWLSDVVSSIGGYNDTRVGKSTRMYSEGTTNIRAKANLNMDGAEIRMNEDASSYPSSPISEKKFKEDIPYMMHNEAVKALIHGMIPPQLGTPLNNRMEAIQIPEPCDVEGTFETSSDMSNKLYDLMINQFKSLEGNVELDNGKVESVSPCGKSGTVIKKVNGSRFSKDYKLSDHFTLGDLTVNSVYPHTIPKDGQKGLSEEEIVTNLKSLAINVLENVLPYLPNGINGKGRDWKITSGFRKDKSGSSGSQHTKGQAVDIQICERGKNVKSSYNAVRQICANVPFDQAILEYSNKTGNCWIHLSFKNGGSNRKSMLTMTNQKYLSGFRLV